MFTISNIIFICWLIFLGYWIINWNAVKPTQEVAWRQQQGFRWIVGFIVVVIVLIAHFFLPRHSTNFFTFSSNNSLVLQIIGSVLAITGLIIAIIARKTLADNWSSNIELKKNHKLITTGVYKYIRHPIYTGVDLMGIGTIIASQSFFVIFFLICMMLFFVFKMKKEETLLMKHFPKEYPEYKKKTKALIPFIY